jgi:serine/threonine-protein kinase
LADPEDWSRLDALLDAALERPPAEREAFLDEACKDHPERRGRLAEILRLAEEPDERMEPGGGLRGPVWEELAEEMEAEGEEPPLAEGAELGRYVIRGLLGTGGMGRVYRARDPTLDRDVAIKAVTGPFRDDAASLRRFEREARLLATLNHPNIAAIYGFELIEGAPYLVLELVEGPTLRERLEKGPLSVAEALGVAVQVADALQEAHDKGIVHRDLKPANITLGDSGRVKILDFGIAKPVGASLDPEDTPTAGVNPTTTPGAVIGTAAYMSPEQARGQPIDTRTDVWAFGCLLYEMLTGVRAFPGNTSSDVLAAILRDEVDFSRLPSDTPEGMRRLLQRCLRKDPRERLQDAGDARIELTEAAMEEPPLAPSPAKALSQKLSPVLVGLAVALLGTALGLRFLSRGSVPGEARVVRLGLDLPPDFSLANDYAAPFALSPDGGTLVVLSRRSPDRESPSQLFERTLSGLDLTPIPGTSGAWQPTFAPDGRRIAFFADRKLKTVPLGGGPVETVAEIGGNPRGASWGEDGTIVFAPSQNSGLMRVSARGGRPEPFTRLDEGRGEISHRWPQTLPGGRHILFTVAVEDESYDDARLEVASLESGERRVLVTGGAYGRYVAATGHLVFARGGRLFAAAFDLSSLAVRGSPVMVAEGVRYDPRNGGTHMAPSPSGTLIFGPGPVTSNDHRLAWMDGAGDFQEIMDTPRAFREVRLSPDARRVALVMGRGPDADLWMLDLESGTLSRLTFGSRPRRPVWTPDGRRVAVAIPSGQRWRLASVGLDGGAPSTLLESDHRVYPNVFTPDGTKLVYQERRPGTGWDILIGDVDPAGRVTGARPLVASPVHDANADLSPDGRFLAYESDELDGVFEVYVRPLEGGVKVRATTTGARWPRFGAAGRLYYWYSFEGGLHQIDYRAESDRFVVGPTRPVVEGPANAPRRLVVRSSYESFDVDAPRRRLLVLANDPETTPSLTRPVVVLNWADELRALAP